MLIVEIVHIPKILTVFYDHKDSLTIAAQKEVIADLQVVIAEQTVVIAEQQVVIAA